MCSATTSLSKSGDLSSSSRLCLTTLARPFSISCSATLLTSARRRSQIPGGIGQGETGNPRIMTCKSYSCTFPLIKLPLFRPYEVNRDLDMFADQLLPQEFPGLVSVVGLFRIRLSKISRSHKLNERRGQGKGRTTHFGALVELNCILLSFPSLSTTLSWSPLHTLITVPSKLLELPPEGCPFVFEAAIGRFAYKQSFFSLATLSAARSRSIPPELASMPACQSTTRAKPAATRCSARFPKG